MGNLSSSTLAPRSQSPVPVPLRSPATASQQVSSDDSVYETYQVPFGLAREINRLCSEFHKLQQAAQSGGPLPSEAVFQVDLIQIIHLTNPEANRRGNESLGGGQRSQFSHQPSSGANHAPPPSGAQWSQPNSRAVQFRDPSMPLILRLDKKQLMLLQESSSSNAFSESDFLRPSNLSRSTAFSNDAKQIAATSGAGGRANGPPPRVRLAAASQAIIGANSLQKGGLQYSGRQQVQQQFLNHAEEASVRSDGSVSMAHAASAATFARQSEFRDSENDSGSSAYRDNLRFDSPHVDAPRTWTHLSGNDRVSSFTHRAPGSHESVGPSASSESRVDHGSSTPAYARSTFHGAQEAGRLQSTDADARGVLGASASPNSVNSFVSSQSLVSDDVEAKRKILAEVRLWRNVVCS
jgi:hypothetical protein